MDKVVPVLWQKIEAMIKELEEKIVRKACQMLDAAAGQMNISIEFGLDFTDG